MAAEVVKRKYVKVALYIYITRTFLADISESEMP